MSQLLNSLSKARKVIDGKGQYISDVSYGFDLSNIDHDLTFINWKFRNVTYGIAARSTDARYNINIINCEIEDGSDDSANVLGYGYMATGSMVNCRASGNGRLLIVRNGTRWLVKDNVSDDSWETPIIARGGGFYIEGNVLNNSEKEGIRMIYDDESNVGPVSIIRHNTVYNFGLSNLSTTAGIYCNLPRTIYEHNTVRCDNPPVRTDVNRAFNISGDNAITRFNRVERTAAVAAVNGWNEYSMNGNYLDPSNEVVAI